VLHQLPEWNFRQATAEIIFQIGRKGNLMAITKNFMPHMYIAIADNLINGKGNFL